MPEIVILGGGPTGLGAAWRLHELGCEDWLLLERESIPGGLSASEKDEHGFTWDLGGHVLFSHYEHFDRLMDTLLGRQWVNHQRESWIWMARRFIPYPFQNNIRHLPPEAMWECLRGIIRLYARPSNGRTENFRDWIIQHFGEGIADLFLIPYNTKVWAYPPEDLEYNWVGERVARVDLERITDNILHGRDDISWGPNSTFRFPLHGGTGAIWRAAVSRLPEKNLRMNCEAVKIDPKNKIVTTSGGDEIPYKRLISTIPIPELCARAGLEREAAEAARLRYSSTHVVGVGLQGRPQESLGTKCWMYFPEANCPFYRVTMFSNYSHNNVPDITRYWSLMCEVSESPRKPVDAAGVVESVLEGCLATSLIRSRKEVCCTYYKRLEYSYPTPALGRTEVLNPLLVRLMELDIYSRGRFGAWKYEVGNQDHSYAQGVEVVNKLYHGIDEVTVWYPEIANGKRPWTNKK